MTKIKPLTEAQVLFDAVNEIMKMSDEFVNEEYCIKSVFAERAAHQLRLRNIQEKTLQKLIIILKFSNVITCLVEGLVGEQTIYAVEYLTKETIFSKLQSWRANVHVARDKTRWLHEDRLERYRICFPNHHIEKEPEDMTRKIVKYYLTSNGNLGKVATLVGVPRHELERVIEKNFELKQLIDSCNEAMLDDVEERVVNRARRGDFDAAKYVLDHKAKKRGYGMSKRSEEFVLPSNGVTIIEEGVCEADARQSFIDTLRQPVCK